MKPAMLHSWFKPTVGFALYGDEWAGNSHFAIRGVVAPDDARRPESAPRLIGDMIAPIPLAPSDVRRSGRVTRIGDAKYLAYYTNLIDAAYPGITWHSAPVDERAPAIARLGGDVVAIVMARTGDDDEFVAAPCPACDGRGGDACEKCDGSGQVEHDCNCEHCDETEDCDRCTLGVTSVCPACKGSKTWTPEAA